MAEQEPEQDRAGKAGIYIEDALILLSIGLLFWLGVLHRDKTWARIAMVPVLVVMIVVLVRRVVRVHRAMRNRQ